MDFKIYLEIGALITTLTAAFIASSKWIVKKLSLNSQSQIEKIQQQIDEEKKRIQQLDSRIFQVAMGKSLRDILSEEVEDKKH